MELRWRRRRGWRHDEVAVREHPILQRLVVGPFVLWPSAGTTVLQSPSPEAERFELALRAFLHREVCSESEVLITLLSSQGKWVVGLKRG
jgi:hypothetical protein